MDQTGASEGEDSSCEDSNSKSLTEDGATKKTRNSESNERPGHQPVIGMLREPSRLEDMDCEG